MKRIVFALVAFFFVAVSAAGEIRVAWEPLAEENGAWQLSVLVRTDEERPDASPVLVASPTLSVSDSQPEKADLSPRRWTLFHARVTAKSPLASGRVVISLPGDSASQTVELTPGIDLMSRPWTALYAGEKSRLDNLGDIPDDDASGWRQSKIPRMWNELGVTWIRTEFIVPKSWTDAQDPFFLTVSAIDDNDVSFFNGVEIGRTNGWDALREYRVPGDLIRFGEKNRLDIAVHNANAGGGIQAGPVWFGYKCTEMMSGGSVKLFPKPVLQREFDRRDPRKQGDPLPLRPMTVRKGVLEFDGGGEVALWGVNYYPQSWNEFRFLKEAGHVDMKAVIDADMADLVRDDDPGGPRRINAIRIHVFDTEISDAEGNLVVNEHLDLLDYLVSQCNDRGVHLWLTPIAWWSSPQGRKGAFSDNIPMPAMTLCRETWPIQQRFFRQFLEHENPYTGRRLVDEPCLNLLEIINEPLYCTPAHVAGDEPLNYGINEVRHEDRGTPADSNFAYMQKIRRDFLRRHPGEMNSDAWDYYRYETVRDYIDTMVETIRATGARQPIAYCAAWFNTDAPVFEAIGDSRCDAVTTVLYPGGLQQTPQADARNLLVQTVDAGLPACLSEKARLVYEFDASDTLRQIDLYPAMARYFRNIGVQVACQFQYDSRFNAAHNRAWPTHYLNAAHTPERYVSFLIGGEVFRRLPRGTPLTVEDPERLVFSPAAVSWPENAALFVTDDLYMQARPTDWTPIPLPEKQPKRIIAVGDTPWFDYEGTGIIDVAVTEDGMAIQVEPDVDRLQDGTLQSTPEKPLTRLESRKHRFHGKSAMQETELSPNQLHRIPKPAPR